MYDFLLILIAYLLGSIPFGLILARRFGVSDIRRTGSGNIGATNVLRAAGPVPAILVTLADILKGTAAILLVSLLAGGRFVDIEYLKLTAGIAAVLGHIFSIFLRFKGGKGVNTALGVFVILIPLPTLISLSVFIITVIISRYISLGSILAAVSLPAVIIVEGIFDPSRIHPVYLPTTIILALLIIFAHRSNIKRLLQGAENKFALHSRHPQGGHNG